MPFSFLMLSFLGVALIAAAMAVIPLIVHLLHRQKVTPIAWGAMQFLLENPLRVRRRRKIDNWLLMLLRMAILILLVFLLARPVWKTATVATTTPVDIALVIDHSLTMGMRTGTDAAGKTGTLFDQGIDLAQRVSQMLPPSGTISVVLAENAPRIITPTPLRMGLTQRSPDGTPLGEWAKQLQLLRTLKPGMTKGDIPAAVQAARELLSHGNNPRKIILVVSDDQRTNWNPGDEKAWTAAVGHVDVTDDRTHAIPVFRVPLRPQAGAANVTVRTLQVLPDFLGVHRPAQIVATVSNTGGTELANVPIVLEVDGKIVATRPLATLAVGDSSAVRFDFYFPEPGSHWVRVRADVVDALDADNAVTAAINVKPRLPVLIVDGQLIPPDSAATPAGTGGGATPVVNLNAFPQAAFLFAAMQPVDPTIDSVTLIEPRIISAAEFATLKGVRLEDYPIIVLNDVPRLTTETVARLAAHAQAGNGVWLILGPRTEESFINDVLARSTLLPITTKGIARAPEVRPGDAAATQANWVTIDVKDPNNGAVSLLTHAGQSEHNALADVTLRSWWTIAPVQPDARTVLATTTGDPLVLEMDVGKLGGKAVVWTTSVGNLDWNNLPLVPNFLPLVNETLFELASGQDSGQRRRLEAGQPLTWTGPTVQAIDAVQLLCPDGATLQLHPEIRGDHYYVEERDTALPGLYEMRFTAPAKAGATAPPAAYFSVNISPDELDPAVLAADDLDWFKTHGFLTGAISLAAASPRAATAPAATASAPSAATSGTVTLTQALEATHGGMDFWSYLALLLLVFLVLEVLMTFILVRRQSGKTLEEEGLDFIMPKGTIRGGST
jgi:hypothetical protein